MKLKNVLRWEYRVRLVSCLLPSVIRVRKDKRLNDVLANAQPKLPILCLKMPRRTSVKQQPYRKKISKHHLGMVPAGIRENEG